MRRAALCAAVTAGALVMLFPFAWTVITSITPGAGLGTPDLIPDEPGLDAYRTLLDAMPFWRILANSLWIAVAS